MLKIYSQYEEYPPESVSFPEPTLTQQQYKNDVNINQIIARFHKTGILPSGNLNPVYGDVSNVRDLQTMRNIIIEAEQNFLKLPAKIRKRFRNDPAELLTFMAHEDNRSEAISLGLIEKPKTVTVPPLDVTVTTDNKTEVK